MSAKHFAWLIIVLGGLAGLTGAVWLSSREGWLPEELTRAPWHTSSAKDGSTPVWSEEKLVETAVRYVQAVQEGRTDQVVDMVDWMKERINRGILEGQSEDALRFDMESRLQARSLEGNVLRYFEGVDDPYALSSSASVDVSRIDAGRDDLESDVAGRVWLRITYPSRNRALHDQEGYALRSFVVGVNVSKRGTILKAGIRGNLEIDFDSIVYDWPVTDGGSG